MFSNLFLDVTFPPIGAEAKGCVVLWMQRNVEGTFELDDIRCLLLLRAKTACLSIAQEHEIHFLTSREEGVDVFDLGLNASEVTHTFLSVRAKALGHHSTHQGSLRVLLLGD